MEVQVCLNYYVIANFYD